MTDFVFDAYRKRCWSQLRNVAEFRINLVDSFTDDWDSEPMVKKFHSCLLSPLVPPEVKNKYYNCLKRNSGDISKCPKTFENFKRKGMVELCKTHELIVSRYVVFRQPRSPEDHFGS